MEYVYLSVSYVFQRTNLFLNLVEKFQNKNVKFKYFPIGKRYEPTDAQDVSNAKCILVVPPTGPDANGKVVVGKGVYGQLTENPTVPTYFLNEPLSVVYSVKECIPNDTTDFQYAFGELIYDHDSKISLEEFLCQNI